MNIKELSIIVPVYNVEKYLKECLDSINEIKNIDYELIIVNDGSPDNSQKIIEEFCKKNERARYYIKENGGLSSARNYGLKRANGEYVWFVDSDDVILSSEFEKFFLEIKKEKVDVLYGNYYVFKEEKVQNKLEYFETKEFKYIFNLPPAVWKNIYRRKMLIKKKQYFLENFIPEDLLFSKLLLNEDIRIKYVNIAFYFYRIDRDGNLSKKLNKRNNYIIVKKLIQKLKKDSNIELKKYPIQLYKDTLREVKIRDIELEKELWKIEGIYWFKLKKKIKIWIKTYLRKIYKIKGE